MKKIGEIKGVPVVEGDANLVKNQILYKETDKGISLSKRTNGKLEEVSGGSNTGGSKIKSRKVYWTFDNENATEEQLYTFKEFSLFFSYGFPIYSSRYITFNDVTEEDYKYYGPYVMTPFAHLQTKKSVDWWRIMFEEAIDIERNTNGLLDFMSLILKENITKEALYEMCALKEIPHEDYYDAAHEIGKVYVE